MTKARSNATANAAKGDLTVGNGTNLSGVLAVGSNGDTIVADSSTSTGLRYTAGTVQDNPVLNSAMQLWQRGTSFAITVPAYTADRWQAARAGNVAGSTVSRQVTNDTTNLPNIQYCLRFARDSGNTSTNVLYLGQSFESINSIPFAGKTVTVSFYARAGANYSSASSILNLKLLSGTGTDQNNLTAGYTGAATVVNTNATLTTTWQRFTVTGTVAATATELAFLLENTPVGTAGAADFYELTGLQIDVGSVALPFRTNAGTIQGELAACQRYYWRATGSANNYYTNGLGYTGTEVLAFVQMPVSMRVAPTVLDYSNLVFRDGSSTFGFSSMSINQSGTSTIVLYAVGLTGLTTFRPYYLANNNTTAGYFGLGAEL